MRGSRGQSDILENSLLPIRVPVLCAGGVRGGPRQRGPNLQPARVGSLPGTAPQGTAIGTYGIFGRMWPYGQSCPHHKRLLGIPNQRVGAASQRGHLLVIDTTHLDTRTVIVLSPLTYAADAR